MKKTMRQTAREKATIGVYQHLTVNATEDDILNYLHMDGILEDGRSAMEFCRWLIDTTIKNEESYKELISKYLKKGWRFERLSKMEQAILLVAACELLESDLQKSIIINEAVINAKEYCDEDAYKFINGVLNKLI